MNGEVTFAILAGGRGSRLGGVDKGLLKFAGRTMVERVLDDLPASLPVLIIANRNLEAYRTLGPPVFSDPWPDFRGPLAGIFAALQAASTEWVQIMPCDGFAPARHLSNTLLHAARANRAPAAFPRAEGRGQFLYCLLRRDLRQPLGAALESGERRAGRWLANAGARAVDLRTHWTSTWSVNTPEERCLAESQLMGPVQSR